MTFFSITLTLFLIMDAIGVIPTYLKLVDQYPCRKQCVIAIRELLIALLIVFLFLFIGKWLLTLLSVSKSSLRISGGIIFFLIALRLIFPGPENPRGSWEGASPFIVPLATPLVAGPTLIVAVMIFSLEESNRLTLVFAILLAWFLSTLILLFARPLYRIIGEKGLTAFERLMGLILTLIAIQMIIVGCRELAHNMGT